MINYKAKIAYKSESVAENYDKDRFSNLKGKLENYLETKAITLALKDFPNNTKILDVPCGTGRITEVLLKKGFNVTGIDISESMLKVAKKKLEKYPNLDNLVVGDAENLPFDDDFFYGVVSVRFFGHIPYDTQINVLKEFARISNKYIIVGYPIKNTIRGFQRKIFNDLNMWFPVTRKDIIDEARKSNLKVINFFPIFGKISETCFVLFEKL